MTHRFAELMFTPAVKRIQEERGSRAAYQRLAARAGGGWDRLTSQETDFISRRDSFYLATSSQGGWPYVQHRGGPAGFLKVLDDRTVGFADYRGNRQYVSVGNLETDDRAALILMDYPHRQRLKLLGHARSIEEGDEPALCARLKSDDAAIVEQGILITVEAYDWNCPQHITQRFTLAEIDALIAPLHEKIAGLEARLATSGVQDEPGHPST